jgi:hypothetical protein
MIVWKGPPLNRNLVVIEEVNNPAETALLREQDDQLARNQQWLQGHWSDLLPGAFGKFVAVAGQQAFVAENSATARARAVAAHLEDKGVLVQFVRPEKGPRLYANWRQLDSLR